MFTLDLRFQPESQRATSTSCSRFLSSCPRGGASSSPCDPTPWYPDPACPRPSVRQPHIGTAIHLLLPGFQIHLPRLSPTIRPPTPYRYLSPTTCLPDADPASVPDHESCLVSRQDKSPSSLCPVDPHLDPNPTRDITTWPNMDPAGKPATRDRYELLVAELRQQHERLLMAESEAKRTARIEAQQEQLMGAVKGLFHKITESTVPATPVPVSEPRVGEPERYGGDPEGCGPFITNCSIFFAMQPNTYSSETAKVAFTVNHLTGRARLWGTAEWERQAPACASFQAFASELRMVFGGGRRNANAAQNLLNMRQGNRSVADYAIDFRTRASQCDWHSSGLCDVFVHGLASHMKDELAVRETPPTLDGVIELATRIDVRMQERRRERLLEGRGQSPTFRPREYRTLAERAHPDETEAIQPGHYCPLKANARQ